MVAVIRSTSDSTGGLIEWVKYSSYGTPFGLPAGDTDSDGDWDATDSGNITGSYDVRKDADLNGTVDGSDITHAGTYQTLGRGVLSSTGVYSRLGYAGYPWDRIVGRYHVRHRVLAPELGRWLQRDPLGYVDGMSLYEYAASAPNGAIDPMGLSCHGTCEGGGGSGGGDAGGGPPGGPGWTYPDYSPIVYIWGPKYIDWWGEYVRRRCESWTLRKDRLRDQLVNLLEAYTTQGCFGGKKRSGAAVGPKVRRGVLEINLSVLADTFGLTVDKTLEVLGASASKAAPLAGPFVAGTISFALPMAWESRTAGEQGVNLAKTFGSQALAYRAGAWASKRAATSLAIGAAERAGLYALGAGTGAGVAIIVVDVAVQAGTDALIAHNERSFAAGYCPWALGELRRLTRAMSVHLGRRPAECE